MGPITVKNYKKKKQINTEDQEPYLTFTRCGNRKEKEGGCDVKRRHLAHCIVHPSFEDTEKDRGCRPWTIVISSFVVQVIIHGIIWTVGIWNSVFIHEFHSTAAKTSLIGSLLNSMTYLGGLISSLLIFKYSCRTIICIGGALACFGLSMSSLVPCIEFLYLTFSIITGLGLGFAFTPSVVIICDYFEEKRSIALGIASSGAGFGSFIFSYINKALLDTLTWRSAIVANACFVVCIMVAGLVMRPFPIRNKENIPSDSTKYEKGMCLNSFMNESKQALSLFKIPSYSALCVNNFMMLFGYTMIIVHNVEFYKTIHFLDISHVPLLVSVFGISNLFGRIGFGIICYYAKGSLLHGIFGFHSACMGPLIPEVTIKIVGPNNISIGYGFLLVFEGIGAMISPPLAGGIYDKTFRYDISFYMGGSFLIGAGLILGATHNMTEVYERRRKYNKDKPPPKDPIETI
ncbi:SLC16A5 [Lepeophtheirus salmonis]|uniref:SLC16A5 n=1 Tax=Lepeophtheirus salmonis TaxID=72036 RepID=A0A7R8CMK4_LEPSM|nr:SLC16A5 [Lepeophtheirus salmonis]CAF2865039.1 SLC16A5 [Lepeophtheirus salmonis]